VVLTTVALMLVGSTTELREGGTTMAEGQRMTAAEVVARVRDGRLEGFVGEAVVLIARELMEAEISGEIGAELGEVAPETRVTHRNGYRPRPWETRVGEIELLIPRKRQGSYFPSFLEPRRRSEQAIVAVVLEAYVNGVSTRKVDRLVEQPGDRGDDQGSRERDVPGAG
jgi:putative transposase